MAALAVVGQEGDLLEPAAAVPPAVSAGGIAIAVAVGVGDVGDALLPLERHHALARLTAQRGGQCGGYAREHGGQRRHGVVERFCYAREAAGLMPDLRDKRRLLRGRGDAEALARGLDVRPPAIGERRRQGSSLAESVFVHGLEKKKPAGWRADWMRSR